MEPAKASHPAAAGDAVSVGGAELACVVPHTRAGGSAEMQGQMVADGPGRDHRRVLATPVGRSAIHIAWMMRRLLIYVLVGPLVAGGWLQAGEMRRPAGRLGLTLTATVAPGGGMGPTMGEGRLILLDGTAHAFSVSGLNLQGHVGSSIDLEAKGEVYNLQRLGDFAGTYRRAIGAVDPERPTNTLILENEQGVRIVVTVTAVVDRTDVRVLPSDSGVTVKLQD